MWPVFDAPTPPKRFGGGIVEKYTYICSFGYFLGCSLFEKRGECFDDPNTEIYCWKGGKPTRNIKCKECNVLVDELAYLKGAIMNFCWYKISAEIKRRHELRWCKHFTPIITEGPNKWWCLRKFTWCYKGKKCDDREKRLGKSCSYKTFIKYTKMPLKNIAEKVGIEL